MKAELEISHIIDQLMQGSRHPLTAKHDLIKLLDKARCKHEETEFDVCVSCGEKIIRYEE
jgi:hypothetical protein